jgi:hypothetical protein
LTPNAIARGFDPKPTLAAFATLAVSNDGAIRSHEAHDGIRPTARIRQLGQR